LTQSTLGLDILGRNRFRWLISKPINLTGRSGFWLVIKSFSAANRYRRNVATKAF
jgi:hypothetical protein